MTAEQCAQQNMAQLGQVGVIAQQNFVTVGKAADYSYLQGKDQISHAEAMGVREVSSKPTGT